MMKIKKILVCAIISIIGATIVSNRTVAAGVNDAMMKKWSFVNLYNCMVGSDPQLNTTVERKKEGKVANDIFESGGQMWLPSYM